MRDFRIHAVGIRAGWVAQGLSIGQLRQPPDYPGPAPHQPADLTNVAKWRNRHARALGIKNRFIKRILQAAVTGC